MTNTIDLARDADGHVALDHAQAAAWARWQLGGPEPSWVNHGGDVDERRRAMARYVLASAAERERVAGVVAAAVRQTEAADTWGRALNAWRDGPDDPDATRAAELDLDRAQHATVAAVRAAGLAGVEAQS